MDMSINKNRLELWGLFFLPSLVKAAHSQGRAGEAGCVKRGTALFPLPLPSLGGEWSWLGPCQEMLGVSVSKDLLQIYCLVTYLLLVRSAFYRAGKTAEENKLNE